MDAAEIKQTINSDDIIRLLESLGCEHIKTHSGYITSTKGGASDNKSGVVVYTKDYSCLMPTTPEFDKYPVKDIFSVIQQIEKCSFPAAVKRLCDIAGIDYCYEKKKETFLSWLDKIESSKMQDKEVNYLDESILDNFIKFIPGMWRNEGINDEEDRFLIRYDLYNDSIIIPIINSYGDMVGIKCRTTQENPDSKYWYMYPCEKTRVLYGAYQNYEEIMKSGEVLVYEAEKSVIKSCDFGVKNCVALAGKKISSAQAEEIIRLGCDIVVALDNDVSDEEIYDVVKQLTFPIALNNVYVLKDSNGMYLDDKDSPADVEEFIKEYGFYKELYLRKGDSL